MRTEEEIRERIEELESLDGIDYEKVAIHHLEWVLEEDESE